MKVLVTGANGFLGRAIVAELIAENFEVEILINRAADSEKRGNRSGVGKIWRADIRKPEQMTDLRMEGKADIIIHSAGLAHQFKTRPAADFWEVNVGGTKNVCEAAASMKARHLILISSVAVYGSAEDFAGKKSAAERRVGISEDAVCEPREIYAQSKLKSEQTAREICEKNGIRLTILRPATIIGEGDMGNLRRLIEAIDRKRFVWIGRGENLKSLIYKGDVAAACRMLAASDSTEKKSEVFNLTAAPIKMREIVSEIERRLDRKVPPIAFSPSFLNLVFALNRKTFGIEKVEKLSRTVDKWLSDDVFSGEKLRAAYQYRTKTAIVEALERETADYKRTG